MQRCAAYRKGNFYLIDAPSSGHPGYRDVFKWRGPALGTADWATTGKQKSLGKSISACLM